MNKILIGLFSIAMITLAGVATGLVFHSQHGQDLKDSAPINLIVYNDDSKVDQLTLELGKEQDASKQQSLIQDFMKQNHKFFSANQILKVLTSISQGLNRNYAINVMKSYISPLSTDEAVQILQLIFTQDGLASGIIVSQIYDLYNNNDNINKLQNSFGYQFFKDHLIEPQSKKYFGQKFALTTEGNHVGFIIDNSSSMCKVVGKRSDGSNISRWNHVQDFTSTTKFDIFQKFYAFSYTFLGNKNDFMILSNFSQDQYSSRIFNNSILIQQECGGDFNLLEKLQSLLQQTNDQLSDVYIWTDASTIQDKDINEILSKISTLNSQRKNKLRINTISFMIGGEESEIVRERSTKLLQSISDLTGGTFVQYTSSQ